MEFDQLGDKNFRIYSRGGSVPLIDIGNLSSEEQISQIKEELTPLAAREFISGTKLFMIKEADVRDLPYLNARGIEHSLFRDNDSYYVQGPGEKLLESFENLYSELRERAGDEFMEFARELIKSTSGDFQVRSLEDLNYLGEDIYRLTCIIAAPIFSGSLEGVFDRIGNR